MDELCELVTDGTHDSPRLQTKGVPFIKGKNISGGKLDFSTCDFITIEDHTEACKRVKPQRGDILFSNIGSVGDTAVVMDDREFSIKNVALFRPDRRKVDQTYFYYLVLSPQFRSNIMNIRSGSAQPFISLANLRAFEVSYNTDIIIQRRIAGILSAYDDLIENNQRRIAILEAMARGLYREWFVHYRYPGHEDVPLVDSPLGPIPQGWEVRKLADTCRLTMGQSPKLEYYNEVGDGVAFHQGVTDFGDRFPSDRLFCSVGGRYAETGDILFSVRAPVGRMNIANKRIILGRGLSAIRHNDNYQAFLWEQLRNRFTKDDMMGNGSIFASVTKDDMQSIILLCPPISVVQAIEEILIPIHKSIEFLSSSIINLRRTRDLLLPRLLSGQIDVGDVE